jgi:hypothetical protein
MDISPDKQNIDRVFSNTTYYIDFYQRDYRWTAEPVLRLLDDVFHKFDEHYERLKEKDLDPKLETVARYPWYYLNTYVTNVVDGRVFIVDGQQRLTTLSLILIKLRHLGGKFDSRVVPWIESKISGHSGFNQEFWMNHVGHKPAQQGLFDGKDSRVIDVSSGITAQNMVGNYQIISDYVDAKLGDKHVFETFVFYFLNRLVLINLNVEQTEVSMVFEVINDRGVRLRPYEILKGKLLGQIDKDELDAGDYNGLWERAAASINAFREDELDSFFRFYLKSKFAKTRKDGQRFDGDYHRAMFAADMDSSLGLLHSPKNVKTFLKGPFLYYANLYIKLRKAYETDQKPLREVYYSAMLDLDAPFLLAVAACFLNDPAEEQKIKAVAYEVDRYFSLLQLQNAYDSNDFSDSLYQIAEDIREQPLEAFRAAFDKQLKGMIAARRNVQDAEPLSYAAFKQTGINLNLRFKRYFFARIDEFLAENMNLQPKHPLANLVTKTSAITGFHVEHILARNAENLALFNGDEIGFEQERNRLGGILLLKCRDNISSNDETYADKLKTYANTLYWNETLRADSYKSKLDITEFKKRFDLDLKPYDAFGPAELEARHALLFDLVRHIWS